MSGGRTGLPVARALIAAKRIDSSHMPSQNNEAPLGAAYLAIPSNTALGDSHTVREATPADVGSISVIWLEGAALAFGESVGEAANVEEVEAQILKLVLQQSDNFKFWICMDR